MKKIKRIFWKIMIISIICMGTFYTYLHHSNLNRDPSFQDTGSYLEEALIIRENGGISKFVTNCLTGSFKVAEQKPLYILILSLLAERDLKFFPRAKIVSISFALLMIIALFIIVDLEMGTLFAALAASLLAYNRAFMERATHVTVETLLVFLFFLSWYFLVRALDDNKFWLLAGTSAGLAFATKASGLFIIPIAVISILILKRQDVFRKKWFWAFMLVFFVINTPIITRNIIVYKTPFYEGILSHVPWLDSWDQISFPRYKLVVDWHEHAYTHEGLPTMKSYINDHSPVEIVLRMLRGAYGEFDIFRRALYIKGMPFGSIYSYLFLIIGVLSVWIDKNPKRRVYSAVTFLCFFIPFAWYHQVIPDDRFITPLLPIMVFYLILFLHRSFKRLMETIETQHIMSKGKGILTSILVVVVLIPSIVLLLKNRSEPIVHAMILADDQRELFSWIKKNTSQKDTLLIGPTDRYWGYLWYVGYKGKLVTTAGNSPLFAKEDLDVFNRFLRDMGVTDVIIHRENYRYPERMSEYFYLDSQNSLKAIKAPPSWKLVYQFVNNADNIYIYSII